MAPHTSNWDFFIGKLGFSHLGISPKILIKKEAFRGLSGFFLKKAGGVPVDRTKNNNLVDYAVQLFQENDTFFMNITPEGTRSYVKSWKKGFYHIAVKAQVPIALGYLDFEKKVGGIGETFYPTGDFKKDFPTILAFYKDKKGANPEMYNLNPEY